MHRLLKASLVPFVVMFPACAPVRTVVSNDVGRNVDVAVKGVGAKIVARGEIPVGAKLILEQKIQSIQQIEYQYEKKKCVISAAQFGGVLSKDRGADSIHLRGC